MADHRFEVNKLYNDNSDAYIVVNRSADYVSFRHVATNKVSRRKAKTTYVRGDKYETVTLKNIYGSTIHLLSNGVLSECVDMIIANAKAAYNEAMAEQQEQPKASASTPATFTINPDLAPDYDASFDEAAYTPDVQEVSVIADDIPADHEPETTDHTKISAPETSIQPAYNQDTGKSEFQIGHTYGHKVFWSDLPVFITVIDRTDDTITVTDNKSTKTTTLNITGKDWSDCEGVDWHCTSPYSSHECMAIYSTYEATHDDRFDLHYIPTTYAEHWTDVQQNDEHFPITPIKKYSYGTDYYEWWNSRKRKHPEVDDWDGVITTYVGKWIDITFITKGKKKGNIELADSTIALYHEEVSARNAWKKAKRSRTKQPAITAPVPEVKPKTQPAPAKPERQQEIIACRQHKAKAEARRNTPKPATKKPRHAKKLDETRQILIQFDDEKTPAPTFEPAKLKPKRKPRMPRVKTDYSRQILIDFGEDVPSNQTNQRQAA